MSKGMGLLMLLALSAAAQGLRPYQGSPTVSLCWDQHTNAAVVGYRLYTGGASRNYTNVVFLPGVSTTNAVVMGLPRGGTCYWALTATNLVQTQYGPLGQESDFSAEVSYSVPPPLAPPNLRGPTAMVVQSGQVLGEALLADDTAQRGEIVMIRIDR
jgi:hypothetical protein